MDSYSILVISGFIFAVIVLYLQLVRRRRQVVTPEFDAFMVAVLGLALISFLAAAALHWLQTHTGDSISPMALTEFGAEHPLILFAMLTVLALAASVVFVMLRQDRTTR